MENRFIDKEIIYYLNRFKEENLELEMLTRLWGQEKLTFKGLELNLEIDVEKSFEKLTDEDLKEYAAVIIPAGYVADYLLYAEKPDTLSPAVQFIEKIMKDSSIKKAFICHSLWLGGPIPETFKDRKVTCHNNIIGHVKNMGANYIDEDIVVDGDLITGRDGGLFAKFSRKIIDEIKNSI